MSTSYDLVYDRFLSKITDYELASLIETDLEKHLLKYLKGAITDFKYAEQDMSDRIDTTKLFNITLTETEQEILAKFMLVHWINPNILRLENIRQSLGNRDFSTFSGANFLDKLTGLKKMLIEEAFLDMTFYYYTT